MSLHQLHETRPGLIHDTSLNSGGGARSVTRVDSTIVPSVEPMISTRQGDVHGSVIAAVCGATPYVSSSSGSLTRYTPFSARCCTWTPYDVRSSPASVTSTQLSLVRNSIGSAHPTFSGAIVPIGT